DKISVHYNIGHLVTMEGDSVDPKGRYLIALNKLAIDRFVPVGPLHPQNHQLIDISNDKMQLLYDMPLPLGEPHYVVAIEAAKLKPGVRYKVGTDSRTDKPHPGAVRAGEEKTVKKGNKIEVFGTLIRSHITPETIEAEVGDEVTIHLTNLERAQDETHGFTVSTYNVHASVEPGKTVTVKFKADREGVYPYYCTEFCSALHLEMQGYLLVKPKGWKPSKAGGAAGANYSEADYKAQLKKVADTQAVIDSVVGYITSVNYKDFPDVVNMMDDAVDQLGKIKDAKSKADEAAGKKDWNNAALWTEQIWQYQVKAADLGLRAKTYLEQNGAKKVK
ncbi:MAG TPA: cupredoxin domain-containing protein, partial [Accumulibacter sp.]|uniref:cupredoxin domain-containing protein n=1 Tax=Accumulibacter sp. TaxID=2053492 RepID=UPI002C8D4365